MIVLIMTMSACKQNNSSQEKDEKDIAPSLPAMPLQQQSYLFENVEMIDYIFNDLPFSLSQTEKPSIQSKIAGISQEPVADNNCKPMARVFFQVKGEIVIEADMFFTPPDCQHYVFYENQVAVYANKMAPSNIQFYSRFLTQMNVTQ